MCVIHLIVKSTGREETMTSVRGTYNYILSAVALSVTTMQLPANCDIRTDKEQERIPKCQFLNCR